MSDREPFAYPYDCSVTGQTVTISGIEVSLRSGPAVVASQRTGYRCSGCPACGKMLGQGECPFKG